MSIVTLRPRRGKALLAGSTLLWAGSAWAHGGAGWHVHPEDWAAVALLGCPLGLAMVWRLRRAWRGWSAGTQGRS